MEQKHRPKHSPFNPHSEHGAHNGHSSHQFSEHGEPDVHEGLGDYEKNRRLKKRSLFWSILLTSVMMIVEFIGGFLTGSLALTSDAAHMFTHLFALLVSFFAIKFGDIPATQNKTYGFHRLEILAAFINGITLILISFFIIYESYKRIILSVKINVSEMLLIASVGLAVNLIVAFLLLRVERQDINIRSAFLHMLGDTFSSVAIIAGAIVIHYTGIYIIDPILACIIALLILIWSYNLIKESIHILLEGTPKHLNLEEVIDSIKKIKRVRHIHDVHIWEITSNMYILSAHVTVSDCPVSETDNILSEIKMMLDEKYDITHATIQFECDLGAIE